MKYILSILAFAFIFPTSLISVSIQESVLKSAKFSLLISPDQKIALLHKYTSNLKSEELDLLQYLVGDPKIEIENYAITLFFHLIQERKETYGDTMAIALALANNYLYSIGDEETKEEIKKDIVKHFDFYRSVLNEQKKENLNWNLNDTPLSAKIFWADRTVTYITEIRNFQDSHLNKQITISAYKEFVDRVETLYQIREDLKRNHLLKRSPQLLAKSIEDYIHSKRVYRSSIENLEDFNKRKIFSDSDLRMAKEEIQNGEYYKEWFGKKRRWDEFWWLNYQVNELFTKKNIFKGDCGSTTVVQMGYYKAAGLPVASLQWIHPKGFAAYTHNLPFYFHPYHKRWLAIQNILFFEEGGKLRTKPEPVYLHITKPIYLIFLRKNILTDRRKIRFQT